MWGIYDRDNECLTNESILQHQSSEYHSFGMLRVVSLFLFSTVFSTISHENSGVLLFPQNSVFQFTVGISIPVAMDKRGGISFSSGFQFNYALPWNSSQLDPAILPARDFENFHLRDIYTALEDLLEKYNWQGGRQCLLRSICELAETPLILADATSAHQRDIFEEIIHLLLTPSEDSSESDTSSRWSTDKLYQAAERLGRSGGDCIRTYSDCNESPLGSFTDIVFPSEI